MNHSKLHNLKNSRAIKLSYLWCALSILATGCSNQPAEHFAVTLKLPKTSASSVSALQNAPGSVHNFGCYGLIVAGEGITPTSGASACFTSGAVRPGILAGFVSANGGEIEVKVPSGSGRVFSVIALESSAGCPDANQIFSSGGFGSDIKRPYEVARTTADVRGNLALDVTAQFDPMAPKAVLCNTISAPSIQSVSPTSGAAAGGGTLTLTGTQFQTGMTVSLGSNSCTSVSVSSSTSATCTIPAGSGSVAVTATNPDGQTGTLSSAYSYGSSSSATKLLVTGPASQTVDASCSSAFTVTSADSSDTAQNVAATTTVNLTGNGSGSFYSSSGCTGAISAATIAAGASSAQFYFKGTSAAGLTFNAADANGALTAGSKSFSLLAGAASASNSTIGVSPSSVAANDSTTATVTVTLKDQYNNPISGTSPVFAATGSGNTLVQPGSTDASGVATGTIKSSVIESKTLSITSPSGLSSTVNVSFVGPVKLLVTGPSSQSATASCSSAFTVTTADANDNPQNTNAATSVTLSGGGSGTFYSDASCATSSSTATIATGTNTQNFYFKSTTAESLVIAAAASGYTTGNMNYSVTPGPANDGNSTITVSPSSVVADGSTTATVTITIRDQFNNPISGSTPVFAATGTGNTLVQTGATNAGGTATGTIKSTVWETKTLSITTPSGFNSTANITFLTPPVNLEVPVELTDTPLKSKTTATLFSRTSTILTPTDYDGTVTYYYELVAKNTDGVARTVSLKSGGTTYATVTIPATTSELTRIRETFTTVPVNGTYQVETPATTAIGSVMITSARAMIKQVGARKTRVYVPLASQDQDYSSSLHLDDDTQAFDSCSNTTYGSQYPEGNSLFRWDSSKWSTIPANGITLETVMSNSSAPTASARAILIAKGASYSSMVGGVYATVNTTAFGVGTVSFGTGATNFPDNTDYEVRLAQNGGGTASLVKAGLWIQVTDIRKLQTFYRTGGYLSTLDPHEWVENRQQIDQSLFSGTSMSVSPYFEVVGFLPAGTSLSASLSGNAANDSGTSGLSTVSGSSSSISTGTATSKTRTRSSALSLTNGDRYLSHSLGSSAEKHTSSGIILEFN